MTGWLRRSKGRLESVLRGFHANRRGAIALLTMAACLICFMLALVIWDADRAAMDKLDVQTAADTAAWSQTAVEARAMNMISFANVGKRVIFGMSAMYRAVWVAWGFLAVVVATLTALCWGACVLCYTCLSSVCQALTRWLTYIGQEMGMESPDLAVFEGTITPNILEKDMEALDRYQKYMAGRKKRNNKWTQGLVPWWSWAEGVIRGARNGALVTASWPPPAQLPLTNFKALSSILSTGTNVTDRLPVKKFGQQGLDDMCNSMRNTFAPELHTADYVIKSIQGFTERGWKGPASYGLTTAFAWALMRIPELRVMGEGITVNVCEVQRTLPNFNPPPPYQLKDLGKPQWLMRSSNLVLSYKPDATRMAGDTNKFDFMSDDYEQSIAVPNLNNHLGLYASGGYWGMSRAEYSYQYKGSQNSPKWPDMWHPSWTVRMRPVALPGEWAGYGGIRFGDAVVDLIPYIAVTGTIMNVIGSAIGQGSGASISAKLQGTLSDLFRLYLSADAMDNTTINGVAR